LLRHLGAVAIELHFDTAHALQLEGQRGIVGRSAQRLARLAVLTAVDHGPQFIDGLGHGVAGKGQQQAAEEGGSGWVQ
jgi:hypothetical protein